MENKPSELALAAEQWKVEPQQSTATISLKHSDLFAAILDCEAPGLLPPLWHWFSFAEFHHTQELGRDGHIEHGPLLPDVARRRRVWGGGRFKRFAPMKHGDTVTRIAEISSAVYKKGRSGEMLIVTEKYSYHRGPRQTGDLLAVDEIDVVYRQDPVGSQAASAKVSPVTVSALEANGGFRESVGSVGTETDVAQGTQGAAPGASGFDQAVASAELLCDPALLFRFSQLTNNPHRIHYDIAYAMGVEDHAGLVVHGPLMVLALLELPRRAGLASSACEMSFRVKAPAFGGQPIAMTMAAEKVAAEKVAAEAASREAGQDKEESACFDLVARTETATVVEGKFTQL